jgi:hypothetical protein
MVIEIRPFNCFICSPNVECHLSENWRKDKIINDILSSKSFCFLVNFQTKNAMIPIKATPPATDKPMIEPVPRPEESEGGGTVRDEAEAEAEALDEALPTYTTVVEPPIIVKLGVTFDTALAEVEKKVLVLVLWEDLVLLSKDVEVLLVLVLVEVEVEVLDWEVEVDDLSIGGETEITWRRSKDAEARRKKKDKRREKQTDDWKDFIRKLCQQFGKLGLVKSLFL